MKTINNRRTEIIAEVKTQSPFGFQSKKSWDELFDVALEIGDMISIHTDPRWGGSFALVEGARARTRKPILAKGIHKSDAEVDDALRAGADWVLVVGRVPARRAEKCILEPLTLKELRRYAGEHECEKVRVLWNERDLKTGVRKEETFEEARAIWPGWLAQASFIKTVSDIKDGADAVLVGTDLEAFRDSLDGLQ